MKFRFIGDVHMKFDQYIGLLSESPYPTIQIGDFGVGFVNSRTGLERSTPILEMLSGNHRFIRGNHDNPDACRRHPMWIPDGHTETTANDRRIMFIGGAFSIDRAYRTEGLNFWNDEEISNEHCEKILIKYEKFKPHLLVTHDAPETIAVNMFLAGTSLPRIRTKTGQFLQTLLEIHQPDLWIFGHWHESKQYIYNATQFICLGELDTVDVEV